MKIEVAGQNVPAERTRLRSPAEQLVGRVDLRGADALAGREPALAQVAEPEV